MLTDPRSRVCMCGRERYYIGLGITVLRTGWNGREKVQWHFFISQHQRGVSLWSKNFHSTLYNHHIIGVRGVFLFPVGSISLWVLYLFFLISFFLNGFCSSLSFLFPNFLSYVVLQLRRIITKKRRGKHDTTDS